MDYRSLITALVLISGSSASAQENPFAPGWLLDPVASTLNLQTVKKNSVVELSSFAKFAGNIDADGTASLRVLLDSIDTKIDIRNVRMRFLMFETFNYPEATITLNLSADDVADLRASRRKTLTLPYDISLHGVTLQRSDDVVVTLLDENRISVASGPPVTLMTKDFGLDDGVKKLEEAADVTILPAGTVTFDLIFDRAESVQDYTAAIASLEEDAGLPAALEEEGEFSIESCQNRFETISRTESVYFVAGSAQLDQASTPLLDSLFDVVSRCPNLSVIIAGHTDTDGSADLNLTLSEARAGAVRTYLVNRGIDGQQLDIVGYGEARPAFPNDTPENKRRNRRIEFQIGDG